MGEVVISSGSEFETESKKQRKEVEVGKEAESRRTEEGREEELEVVEEEEEKRKKRRRKRESVGVGGGGGDGMVARWDKLLSSMALRVLLVEADDSTRQIIAALLRKCSYRVAAVADGLKAWEILKGRPHNIDLILTEVDLPSISGYALLTLIMEHDICKSIPVIMMSSQDSVSTVYKCMLKGAADYLVKPIRRNELRNLWQHVWRRQSSLAAGNGAQDESVGQDKAEATSENNAASNHSCGEMAGIHRNKERIEKGSDAQSSCTKPDLEAESAHVENIHQSVQPSWGHFLLNGLKMQNQEMHANSNQMLPVHESDARDVSAGKDANAMSMGKEAEPQSHRRDANISLEACDNNEIVVNTSKETVEFITPSIHRTSSTNVKSKFDCFPHLDLSLKRSHPSDFESQVTEERHPLRHSNASAFTRYTNRPLQPLFSTVAGSYQKETGADSEKKLSTNSSGHNSDAPVPSPSTQRSIVTLAKNQMKESQIAACSQQRVLPIQIPVKGITFNNLCSGYSSEFPQISCKQSGTTPRLSPSSANQPEPSFQVNQFTQSNFECNYGQLLDRLGKNINHSTSPAHQKQEDKMDTLEDLGHISPATDQSATNSFCNGAVSHHFNNTGYGSACGSNSNVDQVAGVRTATESNSESGFTHTTNSHRSVQREAALNKFRMKRKDRCYEKKVRYESRKKLAEQRPRVKGQFVRQVAVDAPPPETD
ncbi:hypothetical protein Tsubulata_011114 [Turnera subulata]|uniref:Two-component response regulator-like APRR5 n=1 Tax=Turnera subulata TaxID=218843 RepID=A0A9Q0FG82_9ROSI|nr:hypothetical protein Tsubulata_011114 [Turnera subulata]